MNMIGFCFQKSTGSPEVVDLDSPEKVSGGDKPNKILPPKETVVTSPFRKQSRFSSGRFDAPAIGGRVDTRLTRINPPTQF